MSAGAIPALPPVVRGMTRQMQIPPCVLKPHDLRRLYGILEEKAREAADRQVAALTQQPGQTQEQFDNLRNQVRAGLTLVLRVQTGSGEWLAITTIDPLADERFPEHILRMEFDSSFIYRSQSHLTANNAFLVTLDLNRPSIFDMGGVPVANVSAAAISGLDATWANGLYDELVTFFRQRVTRRGWLHHPQSYTFFVFLLGVPLTFVVIARLESLLAHRRLSEGLKAAIYIYVVLLVLFLFRVAFNYARWTFPKVEIDAPHQHIAPTHKAAILAIGGMVIAALIAAVLRLLGIG